MKINVPFEVNEYTALRILCEAVDMDIDMIYNTDEELCIYRGQVCRKIGPHEYEPVDDRPDLFAALRNIACAITPNCEFRSDPYITHYGED